MRNERLAHSGLLSLTGSATSALAALVIAIIIGNALGAYGTGLFFQAVAFFTIASQVLRLGTNSSLVRTISEHQAFERRGETWRVVVIAVIPVAVLGLLAGALVWVFSEPLANWLASPGESARLRPFLELMAPFISVGALLAVLQIASRMVNGIGVYTLVHTIVYPVLRLVLVGVVVFAAGTALAAFGAWLSIIPLWVVLSVGLLSSPLLHDWRRRGEAVEPFRDASRRFWGFSATRAVGGSLEILLEWTDVLIVAAIASPAEAGIYAVVTRTVRAGQVVDRAMRLAVSPRISRHLAKGELAETRTLHTTVVRAMILVSWPYYLTLAIMGPSVLLVFGAEFEDGAIPLVILSLTMLITSSAGMLQSIILQGGKSSWQVLNKSIVLVTSIALNLALVPVIGIIGAAITWAVVGLTDTAIAAWQVHRRMGVWLRPRPLLPAMLIATAVFGTGMGIVRLTLGTSLGALVIGVAAVGLVYAGVLWMLRARLGIVALWRELPLLGRFA